MDQESRRADVPGSRRSIQRYILTYSGLYMNLIALASRLFELNVYEAYKSFSLTYSELYMNLIALASRLFELNVYEAYKSFSLTYSGPNGKNLYELLTSSLFGLSLLV